MNSSVFWGMSAWEIMFSTGVATGFGVTVLMVPKAKPRRPSPTPDEN